MYEMMFGLYSLSTKIPDLIWYNKILYLVLIDLAIVFDSVNHEF